MHFLHQYRCRADRCLPVPQVPIAARSDDLDETDFTAETEAEPTLQDEEDDEEDVAVAAPPYNDSPELTAASADALNPDVDTATDFEEEDDDEDSVMQKRMVRRRAKRSLDSEDEASDPEEKLSELSRSDDPILFEEEDTNVIDPEEEAELLWQRQPEQRPFELELEPDHLDEAEVDREAKDDSEPVEREEVVERRLPGKRRLSAPEGKRR